MLPLVIVNPTSRGGQAARDWPKAASTLRAHFGPFECRFTTGSGDATAIAREEALAGRSLLLTFGGDGTISETARGLLESGTACELGVLPHGTGSDFARTLRLPHRLADQARALRQGRTAVIDVGKVVFESGQERFFVNSASFGLSAEVARRVNRAEGRRSYARKTLEAALRFRHPEVEIAVNGGARRRVRITVVSLHNGRFFGGGMKMAPRARLDDALLEVIVIGKVTPFELATRGPLLYFGGHLGLPEVEHFRAKSFEAFPADAGRSLPLELDGEVALALPARFEILSKALRLRLGPAGFAPAR